MTQINLKKQFLLNPEITFLNFGSFGACPRPVFEDYQRWQLALERDPVQFITSTGLMHLENSRKALAGYIHCGSDDVVFVPNPSYAVNIIAKGLPLKDGDEVLSTSLEYGACDKTWAYYCGKKGAVFRRQPVLPIVSRQKFISDFTAGITPRTRAIFISQVTSTTALVLPVKEICAIAKQKGIITIVDGAHVPGHLALDLRQLDADIYTGACHKWMMTPKGCSFLYVKKELQDIFDPLVISWGYNSALPSHSRFLDYHQTQGTRDFSACLTVPRALEFMKENHWESIATRCRALVLDNAARFCALLGSQPLCPLTGEFTGQMFSIPATVAEPEKLQKLLYQNYRIEIPVMRHGENIFIRYSINAFNSQSDLDMLYAALQEIIQNTGLIKVGKAVEA
jgi:isopenicillin-N epimerase